MGIFKVFQKIQLTLRSNSQILGLISGVLALYSSLLPHCCLSIPLSNFMFQKVLIFHN